MIENRLNKLRETLLSFDCSPHELRSLSRVRKGPHAGIAGVTIEGGEPAVRLWKKAFAAIHETHCYPVMVPDGFLNNEWAFEDAGVPAARVVEKVRTLAQHGRWFDELRERFDHSRRHKPGDTRASERADWHSGWPGDIPPRHGFVAGRWGDVDLLFLPCEESWIVPAVLGIGCHNDLGPAIEQCAALHSWQQHYGADIMYASQSTFEFRVTRPPTERKTALQLATEQFYFCPDRVCQVSPDAEFFPMPNTGTLEGLAAVLIDSTAWYFWWD